MKRVKMLRTVERPEPLVGDVTYLLTDGAADSLIADGSAELIADEGPGPGEAKPAAAEQAPKKKAATEKKRPPSKRRKK